MKQSIHDVLQVLGTPHTRSVLTSVEDPFMLRAVWRCGCAVDYVDEGGGAYNWYACRTHKDPAHNEQSMADVRAGDADVGASRAPESSEARLSGR